MEPKLINRRAFDAAQLMRAYPPRWTNENKLTAAGELLRRDDVPRGEVSLSRWRQGHRWSTRSSHKRPLITERSGFFVYGESGPPGTMHWHLNFAMGDCFGAYAGELLAQDELQVLEHPALGSLREAANLEGFSLMCVEDPAATPLLVAGIERRGELKTRSSPEAPAGLYGNEFASASQATVRSAMRRLEPPTISNIVAIEAPACGSGRYERDEIEAILSTAVCGFRAAKLETRHLTQGRAGDARVVLHTGWWGCGAYGGDKELMALLQLLASELAEVDELVFYSVDEDGSQTLREARRKYTALPKDAAADDLVSAIWALRYEWGFSNGT